MDADKEQEYWRKRYATYIDALVGRDPAALGELEAAIEQLRDSPYAKPPYDTTNEAEPGVEELLERLFAALAKFRMESR